MPDETPITITRRAQGVEFKTVTVTQSQLVFWRNEDPQAPHWPFFPDQPGVGPRFQIGSGNTSDNCQPDSTGKAIPQGQILPFSYKCKVDKHDAESGTINVVADFLAATLTPEPPVFNQLPNGTVGVPYAPIVLTSGGLGPYTHTLTDAVLPHGLTITDQPTGVTVGGTPTQSGDNFAFTVNSRDTLGNTVDQTYTLTVVAPPGTVT